MKKILVAVATAGLLSLSVNGVFADVHGEYEHDDAFYDDLSSVGMKMRDQLNDVFKGYNDLAGAKKQLKDAGASYQKSLVMDSEADLSFYTNDEQQAAILGVYTFDAGYSALFFKKKELAKILEARRVLVEKLGISGVVSPKIKALMKDPDSIRDFQVWVDVMVDVQGRVLNSENTTDKHLDIITDAVYGSVIEGLYIVNESIALADYSPEMLDLLNNQHKRVDLLIEALNVFREDAKFAALVESSARFEFLEKLHNILIADTYTKEDVDKLRSIVAPERQAILDGNIRGVKTI